MQNSTQSLDTQCRSDFPVLKRRVRDDKALVYLDNAATTQKPIQVIDAITNYYKNHNSNIHRAVHALAEESTEAFEATRSKIAKFLNIVHSEEIIFVRGTTEAINLIAYAWGRDNVQKGDIIVTTEYEHHSNIVPWQVLTQETGAELRYVDIDDNGELMLEQLDEHLATGKVKLVAV
ncbi:MAG TPA: aminotransferase class V-fold PLP-dependent enzyme, partial [Candidatus Nitrosopelagicus sp.]|nr:aminotransferase class V-fold PLP-dependent enzyme [Candidatus Nitrosopelagicus sp.]